MQKGGKHTNHERIDGLSNNTNECSWLMAFIGQTMVSHQPISFFFTGVSNQSHALNYKIQHCICVDVYLSYTIYKYIYSGGKNKRSMTRQVFDKKIVRNVYEICLTDQISKKKKILFKKIPNFYNNLDSLILFSLSLLYTGIQYIFINKYISTFHFKMKYL